LCYSIFFNWIFFCEEQSNIQIFHDLSREPIDERLVIQVQIGLNDTLREYFNFGVQFWDDLRNQLILVAQQSVDLR